MRFACAGACISLLFANPLVSEEIDGTHPRIYEIRVVSERDDPDPQCGEPYRDSHSFLADSGVVVSVESGDRVTVDAEITGLVAVKLACLDAPDPDTPPGLRAWQELESRIAGRRVRLSVPDFQEESGTADIAAIIDVWEDGEWVDVAVDHLCDGLARLGPCSSYTVGSWIQCHYERTERQAQLDDKGLWAPHP